MLKKILITTATVITLATGAMAQAGGFRHPYSYNGHDADSFEYADVIGVDPIYQTVRKPVADRECWNEEVEHHGRGDSPAGMIIGGIIGGAIGNQFGAGHGRQAATVAGTLLGGAVGRDATRHDDHSYSSVEQRCRVRRDYVEEQYISAYRVTYRYGDRTYTKTMARDPGDRLRVRVDVSPVD